MKQTERMTEPMENCLFCRILRGEIPSGKVYENEYVYAFRDINPQAPVHILVIPKTHYSSLNDIEAADDRSLAECLRAIPLIADREGLAGGYRMRASLCLICIFIFLADAAWKSVWPDLRALFLLYYHALKHIPKKS